MTHERAELIGYSPRDGFRRTKVHTAIGARRVTSSMSELTVLGFTLTSFRPTYSTAVTTISMGCSE
jgi:hypothetical protein